MIWEANAKEKFDLIIDKVPVFMRGIASNKVSRKAEDLAQKDGRAEVNEKDMVDAFFSETPFGFHGPMRMDMEEFGVEYKKYGH